jgi:hypothetical protein
MNYEVIKSEERFSFEEVVAGTKFVNGTYFCCFRDGENFKFVTFKRNQTIEYSPSVTLLIPCSEVSFESLFRACSDYARVVIALINRSNHTELLKVLKRRA